MDKGTVYKEKWYRCLYAAKQRCTNKNSFCFHRYGGRGIKCFLKTSDVKFLWERDKGITMKSPSIDRINNDGNYELSNCRFIERKENRPHKIGRTISTSKTDLLIKLNEAEHKHFSQEARKRNLKKSELFRMMYQQFFYDKVKV